MANAKEDARSSDSGPQREATDRSRSFSDSAPSGSRSETNRALEDRKKGLSKKGGKADARRCVAGEVAAWDRDTRRHGGGGHGLIPDQWSIWWGRLPGLRSGG